MNEIKEGQYFSNTSCLSMCEKYRYELTRHWEEYVHAVVFIMLNPSTADGTKDDATIRRCVSFARSWGYGSLYVYNLFAFRATNPKDLLNTEHDIIGPTKHHDLGYPNDSMMRRSIHAVDLVVVAWGNINKKHRDRAKEVLNMIPKPMCLGRNKTGDPKHPLYLPTRVVPIGYVSE